IGRLQGAYKSVRIGDPLDGATLMGPLIDEGAVSDMMKALDQVRSEGGEILCGGKKLDRPGYYVEPTLVRAHDKMKIVREETFAPILYLFEFGALDEAIALHNSVDQGLSSAIFTTSFVSAEPFLSPMGSD